MTASINSFGSDDSVLNAKTTTLTTSKEMKGWQDKKKKKEEVQRDKPYLLRENMRKLKKKEDILN